MDGQRLKAGPLRFEGLRREEMLASEEVSAMLRLRELGWGTRRIARELGVSRNTVKGYIEAGGWTPYRQPAHLWSEEKADRPRRRDERTAVRSGHR
jgi:predicted transcriptional regulator